VIAADLGAGKSPEEIAGRQHIAIGTVRWHLKSILAKTGTVRQAEAAALLSRSVATLLERDITSQERWPVMPPNLGGVSADIALHTLFSGKLAFAATSRMRRFPQRLARRRRRTGRG
jgi:hypothetical protein